ncbi:MAG: hypothetical protein WAW23_08285 [Candidatus Methanoperedens sp.]
MNNNCIKEKILEALRLFINKDKQKLLQVDIYEPTISHRIAVYLEGLFPDYDIDCEYNKNLHGEKKDVNGKKIRPDIIIHKRLNDTDNCVIIEIKKNGKNSKLAKIDIQKLKDMMIGTLNYDLGVFVGVLKRRIDICWIEKNNGDISESFETIEK